MSGVIILGSYVVKKMISTVFESRATARGIPPVSLHLRILTSAQQMLHFLCKEGNISLFVPQTLMDSDAGRSLMGDKDIDRIKQYDLEVQRALRELGMEVRTGQKM